LGQKGGSADRPDKFAQGSRQGPSASGLLIAIRGDMLLSRLSSARVRRAALALSVCALAFGPAQAKVLATVNGVAITEEDLAVAREDVGASMPRNLDPAQREKALLDYVIDVKLVTQKAAADKLDQAEDFKRKLAYYREKLLMESFLAKATKEGVTETEMKKTYDEASKAAKPETEAHALHILVPTEDEAKKVEARLKAGEDFSKLADELSKDPGSKGGDLGWFTKERMVPEFAEAAFKLEPGKISDPVKTQFGWHVIKLLEKRQKAFPAYDQVKDQLERFIGQKVQSEAIVKIREAAKITRADEPAKADDTKPAEAPKAAAPAPAKKPADAPKPAAPAKKPVEAPKPATPAN
jgi:peptidyl-prolyl cis-trans isomerase C